MRRSPRARAQAADLKRRFNRDFWVEDGEYFALALDQDGNAGRRPLLEHRPPALERHRRQVEGQGGRRPPDGPSACTPGGACARSPRAKARFNPIGYHVGTVWPFDNSFIAWGLRRYGFREEAARIAAGILDAADFFDGRLPEAFGGYAALGHRYPVQYPTACSPQAWSTGAPLLFLRTMLGLEPIDDHLIVDPALPQGIGRLELLDIRGRWGRIDAFGRGRVDVEKRSRLLAQLGDARDAPPTRKRRVHAKAT